MDYGFGTTTDEDEDDGNFDDRENSNVNLSTCLYFSTNVAKFMNTTSKSYSDEVFSTSIISYLFSTIDLNGESNQWQTLSNA